MHSSPLIHLINFIVMACDITIVTGTIKNVNTLYHANDHTLIRAAFECVTNHHTCIPNYYNEL